MAEWLKRAVAMREVSDSSPGRGGYKKLCGRREPSDYVSFRRVVKRQRFRPLNTHDTKPRTTQQHSLQTPYTLERNLVDGASFPPEGSMGFLLHDSHSPLYMIKISHWV